MTKSLTKTASILLILVLAAAVEPLLAQSGRGTITGTVQDGTGALVPGAEVTITNKGNGVEVKAVTTSTGVYRAPYLEPGTYHVSAALKGFKTAVRDNVPVLLTQTVTLDFTLEIGEVTDTVTVSAEAPLLESSTAEIGINATEKEFHTWPILVETERVSFNRSCFGPFQALQAASLKEPSMAGKPTAMRF